MAVPERDNRWNAALHSPPDLAEEFERIAEAWMRLAEGLDPEASEEEHHPKRKKVGYNGRANAKIETTSHAD